MSMIKRKVIQVAATSVVTDDRGDMTSQLVTLCNDGTMWCRVDRGEWLQIEGVPESSPMSLKQANDKRLSNG